MRYADVSACAFPSVCLLYEIRYESPRTNAVFTLKLPFDRKEAISTRRIEARAIALLRRYREFRFDSRLVISIVATRQNNINNGKNEREKDGKGQINFIL